jgi:hypothetical protein
MHWSYTACHILRRLPASIAPFLLVFTGASPAYGDMESSKEAEGNSILLSNQLWAFSYQR